MVRANGEALLKGCSGGISNYYPVIDMDDFIAAFAKIEAKAEKNSTHITNRPKKVRWVCLFISDDSGRSAMFRLHWRFIIMHGSSPILECATQGRTKNPAFF